MKIHQRLKQAREKAGFKTAQDAIDRFRWKYPTYSAHENGTRTPGPDAIAKYAKAFESDPAWIQFGTDPVQRRSEKSPKYGQGFSESEAEFIHKPNKISEIDKNSEYNFLVSRDHMPFGIFTGDYLAIDLKNPAKNGEIIVANMIDDQTATGITLIRRVAGSFLVSSSPTDPLIALDSDSISITGPIRTILRTLT